MLRINPVIFMLGIMLIAVVLLSFTVVDRTEVWTPTRGDFTIESRPFIDVGQAVAVFGGLVVAASFFVRET